MANRRGASPQLLRYIGRKYYEDSYLMHKLAGNPSTPQDVLLHCLRHPVSYVRVALAGNRMVTVEIYRALESDPDSMVRWALTQNEAAPEVVLLGLSLDENEESHIKKAAATRLRRMDEMYG